MGDKCERRIFFCSRDFIYPQYCTILICAEKTEIQTDKHFKLNFYILEESKKKKEKRKKKKEKRKKKKEKGKKKKEKREKGKGKRE